MFEKAARLKLRFDTPKGSLTVEDLWDLPLTSARGASLDEIAMGLNREVKAAAEESFVVKTTKSNAVLQLKFELVKHIIDVRLAENETAKTARETREKKDRILAIIARKQDEALKGAPLEELQRMVVEL